METFPHYGSAQRRRRNGLESAIIKLHDRSFNAGPKVRSVGRINVVDVLVERASYRNRARYRSVRGIGVWRDRSSTGGGKHVRKLAECGYEREAFAGTGLSFWAFWGCPGVNLMVVPPDTYPYVVVVGVVARVATEEAIAGKPRKADAKFIRWLRRFSGGYWPGSLRGLAFDN